MTHRCAHDPAPTRTLFLEYLDPAAPGSAMCMPQVNDCLVATVPVEVDQRRREAHSGIDRRRLKGLMLFAMFPLDRLQEGLCARATGR